MTPRERLFAALNGEPTDHVPVWLLFPWHRVSYYVDVRTHPKLSRISAMAEAMAITLDRRNIGCRCFTADVEDTWEKIDNAEEKITRRTLKYKDAVLFSESGIRKGETVNHKLVSSQEDFEKLCSMPVETDEKIIRMQLDRMLPEYMREKAEFPENSGAMMLDLGEPIGFVYHASNLEELAVASYYEDTRNMITGFLGRLRKQKEIVYKYTLEHDMADVYFMVGSELAAPPFVSCETFREWILPSAKGLISTIHDYGCKVIQHFHGQIREVLPYFREMDADAVHTIEAPPVGNCTFPEAYSIVGGNMTLIGNIQYDDFRSFDAARMTEEVTRLLDENRGRRFILSPTAGPYDPDISDQFADNYRVMLETAWNYKTGG